MQIKEIIIMPVVVYGCETWGVCEAGRGIFELTDEEATEV
jgi:hypothetical protein